MYKPFCCFNQFVVIAALANEVIVRAWKDGKEDISPLSQGVESPMTWLNENLQRHVK